MLNLDAVVIGAGAAGLHCAAIAGQRGLTVLLIDHAERFAEKIRISGGGRCNFTNRDVGPSNFVSANPDFCRSALARYRSQDFLALVEQHRIAWHEKHRGQLFCDRSSAEIITMLVRECASGNVARWQPCKVEAIRSTGPGFVIDTDRGVVATPQLIVATGGLSIPKIGASDLGYRIARQFGHRIVETRPALVPLTMAPAVWSRFGELSGLSLPVEITSGSGCFAEDLLFTRRGLSGPAALQISTYWQPGTPLQIDCLPGLDAAAALRAAKSAARRHLGTVLGELLPRRLAETFLQTGDDGGEQPIADVKDRELAALATSLQHWQVVPSGTEGYAKAEVTVGGVDTRQLDSRSMHSRLKPGLHFIGEAVDVTGWLGGYNFQWAWASAAACALSLQRPATP